MSKVFISHAAADREKAAVVAQSLAERGYDVSFDAVPVTANWATSIKRALEEASAVVMILTSNSASNANVNFELGMAAALSKPIIIFDTNSEAGSVLSSNWAGSRAVVVDGKRGSSLKEVADRIAAA